MRSRLHPVVILLLLASSVLQVLLQVSVVILMRPNHNKLQVTTNLSIGEQILSCLEFELMNEHASQVTFLSSPMTGFSAIFFTSRSKVSFSGFDIFFTFFSKDLDW